MNNCGPAVVKLKIDKEFNKEIRLKAEQVRIVEKAPEYPDYDGPLEVRPASYEQKFLTKYTVLRNDLTVQQIPVHKVTNPSGGYTITIGG